MDSEGEDEKEEIHCLRVTPVSRFRNRTHVVLQAVSLLSFRGLRPLP